MIIGIIIGLVIGFIIGRITKGSVHIGVNQKINQKEEVDIFYCEIRGNFAHETCKTQCSYCKKEINRCN